VFNKKVCRRKYWTPILFSYYNWRVW